MKEDVRWLQRLENFEKAINQLKAAVVQYNEKGLNELEKQGMIQAFEYTFELAWNLIRDYFLYQGIHDIQGSRDAVKMAFKFGIIENGGIWMEIIKTRNLTAHTYNQMIADSIVSQIVKSYYAELEKLFKRFMEIKMND